MKPNWAAWLLLVGIFGVSALLPVSWLQNIPLCYFKYVSGWDCPGCGLTRAFIHLFHGEFRKAIAMNAMAPFLALWFFIYVLDCLFRLKTRRRPRWFTPAGNKIISRSFLVLFLGQWVLKNLTLWWELLP